MQILEENLDFTYDKNITMQIMYHQIIHKLRIFFLKWLDAEASVLHKDALSHSRHASLVCHTWIFSKFHRWEFIKNLNMMFFGISKQLFAKTLHAPVKKLWFSDLGHMFRTRKGWNSRIIFFNLCNRLIKSKKTNLLNRGPLCLLEVHLESNDFF